MMIRTGGSIPLFILAGAVFGQTNGVSNLSGEWVNTADPSMKLTVAEKGDTVHVEETNGAKVVLDYTCPLSGQECEAKANGHSLKVMTYFNGPKLVELKERGGNVEKRRFVLSADGKNMQVEIIPLSSDKTETLGFAREASGESKSN